MSGPPTDVESQAIAAGQTHQATESELLRVYLEARDVACPRCGYNLRTIAGERCTECGLELRLGVSPREPFQRLWIAAIIIAALGAGIGLLFVILAVGPQGLPPRRWWWAIFISWACIPATAWLAIGRRRFVGWPAFVQTSIVLLLAATFLAITFGLATIR